MQVPSGEFAKISSWWSSPKVCPISWHITRFFHSGVLYFAVLKYVSFNLTVPWVIWSPLAHIEAIPSQPFFPYLLLHTSTRPLVARQFLWLLRPFTMVVSSTEETLQSTEAIARLASHAAETLSPSFKLNGFAVRAQ